MSKFYKMEILKFEALVGDDGCATRIFHTEIYSREIENFIKYHEMD